jgi:DegV family protein with EDD domain
MSVKIVSDSTCDLPKNLLDQHQITIVPLYINMDGQSYLDGVQLSRRDFYTRLVQLKSPPSTAAPSPDKFRAIYESLMTPETSEILSIHVSEKLSSTINSARLGAQQTESVRVRVWDSRQLSLGTGYQVLKAAELAAAGHTADEIVTVLESQIERTRLFAALDTLEYLRRSGRVNTLAASLGSILQIKPLLKMYNGVPDSERVRTRKRAEQRLAEELEKAAPLEEIALVHTNAPGRIKKFRDRVQHLLPAGDLLTVNVTPVIGTHIGPGAIGFVAVSAPTKVEGYL